MEPISPSLTAPASHRLYNPLDYFYENVAPGVKRRVPRAKALSWLAPLEDRFSTRKVTNRTYSFYEEGQYMQANATIAAVSISGEKRIITLSTGDHTSGVVTNDSSFPVEGMLVIFQDGVTQGYVESKDTTTPGAHTVTIKKTSSSMDIGALSVVGYTLVFYSNVQKERSRGTTPRSPKVDKITNKMHTIREAFEITDYAMDEKLKFQDDDGTSWLKYRGLEDTAERFELQKELMLLLAPNSVDLTDKNAEDLQTAFGLIPQVEQFGKVIEYYDRPDKASFDELTLAMDNAFADTEYFVGRGHNCVQGMTNWLIEFAKAGTGQVNFSPFSGGKEQAISLNFKHYSVDEFEFYFNKFDLFSNSNTLGAGNMPFRHYALFIPCGYGKNMNPQLVGSGESEYEPYFKVTYTKPQCNSSHIYGSPRTGGEYMMWEGGALASQGALSDELALYVHMVMNLALELRARNKFFLWKKRNIA